MNIRFTIEEENIVAIYAEDSRETTLENILAAIPYMDEDMRRLAAAAVNKLQAMTDSEFSEREFISVAKRPMEKVVKATLPFYLCMFIALLLLTFVPDISLAIPKLLGGYVSPIANPLGPVFIH